MIGGETDCAGIGFTMSKCSDIPAGGAAPNTTLLITPFSGMKVREGGADVARILLSVLLLLADDFEVLML